MTETAGVVLNNSSWNLSALVQTQGIGFFINIGLLVLVALRVISIIWVAKDIAARTHSLWLQLLSVLLVTILSPILGLPIYLLLRPIGYRYDKMPWREALILNLVACGNCKALNLKDNQCCIHCGEELHIKCKECGKKYSDSYEYCCFCGAPHIR